jgi:hypothetical protein
MIIGLRLEKKNGRFIVEALRTNKDKPETGKWERMDVLNSLTPLPKACR